MIERVINAMRLAHISLAFAGLMWVLPFLDPLHVQPISSFYQECLAAVLGLCAMLLLIVKRHTQRAEVPRITLLPIGLSLLILVQFALGKLPYFDQALLFILYLLWAALLIMLGYRLRQELGLPAMATALAVFLIIGAELNALVGVLQRYFWNILPYYLKEYQFSGAIVGSMAQSNHFADYVTLGLVSLGLLHTRWRLRAWQVALLAAPLLFTLMLSGSRSTWLYLSWMVGMAFLWQRRDKTYLPLLQYSLLLLLGFGLMHLNVQLPWQAGYSGSETGLERMLGESGRTSNSIRFYLWHEAWLIFTQFPWLGAGVGQFSWQHFQLGPVLHRASNVSGLEVNAHNLVMQVAAEMGLAGLLILFGTLALWYWQARSAQRTIYHWWGYSLLAVLAIHSMLEYPYWYAYFLGVAVLALGMLDTTTYRLGLRGGMWRFSVATMLVLGLLSLLQLLTFYYGHNFEYVAGAIHESKTDNSYSNRIRNQLIHDEMAAIQGHALLLRPYVEAFLVETGGGDATNGGDSRDYVAETRSLNERVMHFVPFSSVVYRDAMLLARADQKAAACMQMERAIWAYPEDFAEVREKLRTLAAMDTNPTRFPALLECALQKYGEMQRR